MGYGHRNMMLTVPAGWEIGQFDPKQKPSNHAEFLSEIARLAALPTALWLVTSPTSITHRNAWTISSTTSRF